MKKLIYIYLLIASVVALAAPVKSMLGASETEILPEEESGIPYVSDGLLFWWDGITGLWDGNWWIDLVSGARIRNSPQGDGEFATIVNKQAFLDDNDRVGINTGFTLHCLLETVKQQNWQNWCQIGAGRASGLQNGLILVGSSNPMSVQYRAQYGGTVLNSVPLTGIRYGDTIALDIVFHNESLTYQVYVNGSIKGTSQILEENWNLDGMTVYVGSSFFALVENTNSNLKRYNVLFYNRALPAEEIEYNFNVDKERFGL